MKAGIGHLSEKLQVVKLEGETTIDPNDAQSQLALRSMKELVLAHVFHTCFWQSKDEKMEVEHMLEQCELKISKLLSLTAPLEEVSDRQRRMDDVSLVPGSAVFASLFCVHAPANCARARRMKSTRRSSCCAASPRPVSSSTSRSQGTHLDTHRHTK